MIDNAVKVIDDTM